MDGSVAGRYLRRARRGRAGAGGGYLIAPDHLVQLRLVLGTNREELCRRRLVCGTCLLQLLLPHCRGARRGRHRRRRHALMRVRRALPVVLVIVVVLVVLVFLPI